jgi:dTDP-glucose pyrophosphorylase
MDASLVVLAAGMGSRYGGLKQLDPVGPSGEILLDYSVAGAVLAGIGKVVFVIRREMLDLFRECVGTRYESEILVEYAFQEMEPLPGGRVSPPGRIKPWGTGHAVLAAAPLVRGPFAVINADDYYGSAGFSKLAVFLSSAHPGEYAMVGYRLDRTLSEHGAVSRGICRVDDNGLLLEIKECPAIARRPATSRGGTDIVAEGNPALLLTGAEPTSMNFWGLMPDLFPKLERLFDEFLEEQGDDPGAEFYLPAAISSLISDGEATVQMLHSDDLWLGLTYPEDRARVVAALAACRT